MTLNRVAERLGLDFETLSFAERDRLCILAHVNPDWERAKKVRWILCGGPEQLIEEFTKPSFFTRIVMSLTTTKPDTLMRNRVLVHMGLYNAALLPRHDETIDAIIALVPTYGVVNNRPLDRVQNTKALTEVRSLLTKLPRTIEIERWLAHTRSGPIKRPTI